MKTPKNIHQFLLLALLWSLLSGCQPGPTAVATPTVEKTVIAPATSTATAEPSSTPVPATKKPTPTSEPTSAPLSADGPWLVYLHSQLYVGAKLEIKPTAELSLKDSWLISRSSVVVPPAPKPEQSTCGGYDDKFAILNQDGSGLNFLIPQRDASSFFMDGDKSTNHLVSMIGNFYIFRTSGRGTALRLDNVDYNGDAKGGLLASISQRNWDEHPELLIYEIPSGKVRNRFSLTQCLAQAKGCESNNGDLFGAITRQTFRWSPNGRYLAFSAVIDSMSSDLYVYDSLDNSLRQLTNGPDWVGQYWWSPDGSKIIMEEVVMPWKDEIEVYEYFYVSGIEPSSLWAVSVTGNDIQKLYSLENHAIQGIFEWLDANRFLAYDGILGEAEIAWNLRLVDMNSGKTRILFDENFGSAVLDKSHETIVIYAFDSPKSKYPAGIHLVSTKNSTIQYLEGPPYLMYFPDWDEKTGLFVSDDDCQNDPQSFQAFDYLGNFKCVPKPAPMPKSTKPVRHPAPNGKAIISVKDGLWLEIEGQPAIKISPDDFANVIWCPDSSCAFYSVRQESGYNLYRVSLPDLTIQLIDEGIQISGVYQWLGGK